MNLSEQHIFSHTFSLRKLLCLLSAKERYLCCLFLEVRNEYMYIYCSIRPFEFSVKFRLLFFIFDHIVRPLSFSALWFRSFWFSILSFDHLLAPTSILLRKADKIIKSKTHWAQNLAKKGVSLSGPKWRRANKDPHGWLNQPQFLLKIWPFFGLKMSVICVCFTKPLQNVCLISIRILGFIIKCWNS